MKNKIIHENGFAEGDICNHDSCDGTIKLYPVENCACHNNPPCSACTEPAEYCDKCYWEAKDE